MSKLSHFFFTVTDAAGAAVCPRGEYRECAGIAFQMDGYYQRSIVESGVRTLAGDRAAVSCNMANGWTVARVLGPGLTEEQRERVGDKQERSFCQG